MRISHVPRPAWLVGLALLAAACGSDSDPTGPIPASLAGTWSAHGGCAPPCAFTLVSVSNPSQSIDLVSLGGQVEISIRRSGSFELQATIAAQSISLLGSAQIEGSTIRITDTSGAVDTATYSITGDLLTLEYQSVLTIPDLDGDGSPDQGTVRAVLQRK